MASSRRLLAQHIGARNVNEVAFMKNATHALNQVAQGLSWNKGDVILTTDKEHNSNLVPWLDLERSHGVDHRVLPSTEENTFDLEAFEATCAELGERLKMVSVGHVSNLDGVRAPSKTSHASHMTTAPLCAWMGPNRPHTCPLTSRTSVPTSSHAPFTR
ncbi:MAG: hypothetical protein CM15mP18_4340 [Methanobacteriota archaeon]|nr:MAG: hypothetical protein CM15mP18_4340 [Euryarchaeota archaeon]